MDKCRLTWVNLLRNSVVFMLMAFALFLHTSVAFAGLGANLIPNPSFETGTATVPTGWQKIKSGNATVTFTYPAVGTGGAATKAAQVNVSAYTSGDEYWQPPTVNVTAGQKYQFTASSISNVPVPIIATYVKSAGGNLFANLGTVPASTTWRPFTATVTIPAGVNKVRIQHVLQAKGILTVDDYALQLVTADTPPPPASAPTCSISASPTSVTKGGSATLAYSLTGATSFNIKDDTGTAVVNYTNAPPSSGNQTVIPPTAVKTTYTGTVIGTGGTATCTASVDVTAVPTAPVAPVISVFSAFPTTVQAGGISKLSWTVSGATSVVINGINKSDATTWDVPSSTIPTTTYTLVASITNAEGITSTASKTITVNVTAPPSMPTCSLTPSTVEAEKSSLLTFGSTNATTVTTNFNGNGTSGTVSVTPTKTTPPYTVVASNSTGSVTCTTTVTVPPQSTNLIQNGNLETADPNGVSPSNWEQILWDSSARFTYPVAGKSSAKAVEVTLTSVTKLYGGAAWASPAVAVTATGNSTNKIYQYTNDYMSDVATNVTVEYLHQDNTRSYEWLNVPAATAAGTWVHQVVNITVPNSTISPVKSFTVVHGLDRPGSLTLDNVSLVAMPSGQFANGMVTLVFDDGYASQYANAVPLLTSAGLPATFAIITSYPQALDPLYMNWSQIQDLKAKNFEIAAHTRTHPSLTSLTSAQAKLEIEGAIADLGAQGHAVTTFVYPYGDESPAIEDMVKNAKPSGTAMKGARGSYYGFNATFGNPYVAYDIRLDATTKLDIVKEQINQAKADKRWLIFELHDVVENGNEYAITPKMMSDIINYIKSSGVTVVTLSQGMGLMKP